jgi:protease II
MKTREKVIRKEQEVLGGSFDKDNYIEERVCYRKRWNWSAYFYGL